ESESVPDEPAAVAGLKFVSRTPPTGRSKTPIDRYKYPEQEIGLREGEQLNRFGDGAKIGELVSIDREARILEIKKTMATLDEHPSELFGFTYVDPKVKEGSLLRLGEHVADHGLDIDGPHAAACQLLLAVTPRLRRKRKLPPSGDDV